MTQVDQILACEEKLFAAMKTSDIAALDKLLHNDLMFTIPTGQTITKSMDLENYQSGNMTVAELEVTDRTVTCIDDVATVVMTLHLKVIYHGQVVDGKFRYLRVWKLFNTAWKVIAGSGFQLQ